MTHKYDMHARTFYSINTRLDHKGVQILTADGLRNSTAMDAAAREAAARADMQRGAEANDGSKRVTKRAKKVPVANSEPDKAVLKTLVGWKQNHSLACRCPQCAIPKGTCVRVIPNIGFKRPSEFLKEHCPAITARDVSLLRAPLQHARDRDVVLSNMPGSSDLQEGKAADRAYEHSFA
jgi:hypothetical protein